jgi:hypothetical protein
LFFIDNNDNEITKILQIQQYIPNGITPQQHIPDFILPGHMISTGEFLTLAVIQSVFAIEIGKIWPRGQL